MCHLRADTSGRLLEDPDHRDHHIVIADMTKAAFYESRRTQELHAYLGEATSGAEDSRA